MTDTEKRAALAARIAPDTDSDEVLEGMLALSAALILNRMYPFGYEAGAEVPARYEYLRSEPRRTP